MIKFIRSFNRLTPYFISLLMILTAALGHFLNNTISLFEFWTLLGLSQIISILGMFVNSIEITQESKKENTQINS